MTEYLRPVVPGGPEPDQVFSQKAVELVTRSGFTQRNDASQSIPAEEILVFLADQRKDGLGWTITNYRGRTIGHVTQSEFFSQAHLNYGRFAIHDVVGDEVLTITPSRSDYGVEVEGIANGQFRRRIRPASLLVEADEKPLGSIGPGTRFGRLNTDVKSIWDHTGEKVGQLKSYRASRIWFDRRKDHVLWRDPSFEGEFRQLVLAAPSVVTTIKKIDDFPWS